MVLYCLIMVISFSLVFTVDMVSQMTKNNAASKILAAGNVAIFLCAVTVLEYVKGYGGLTDNQECNIVLIVGIITFAALIVFSRIIRKRKGNQQNKVLLPQFHHAAIWASDYDATVRFYVQQLDLPILRENRRPERGDIKLDLRVGKGELEIFIAPGHPARVSRPEALGLRHLAFRVADCEAAAKELNRRGIVTEPVRVDEFSGGKFTFFSDPDGLPLELHE